MGFSLAAMEFKKSPEALAAFKRYHRVADDWKHPFAWGYFPNAYFRDNWRKYYA